MRTFKIAAAIISATLLIFSSCSKPQENDAEICINHFCQAFFNFKYAEALQYCASGEDGWLRIYLSNLRPEDQDSIRLTSAEPTLRISKLTYQGDSCAQALIEINSVYYLDTIGKPGHLVKEGIYKLFLVHQEGQWKIRMGDLLQSGM